jgi:hypothetical protein
VTLEVDLVAAHRVVLAAEEVVEPDLVERRRRRVGADVPAGAALDVGAVDHHGRVPADVAPDAPFELLVAGEARLALRRDRVDVVGRRQRRDPDVALPGALEDLQEQEPAAAAAVLVDHRVERLEPLAGLDLVDVGVLGGQPVGDDRLVAATDELLLLTHLGHARSFTRWGAACGTRGVAGQRNASSPARAGSSGREMVPGMVGGWLRRGYAVRRYRCAVHRSPLPLLLLALLLAAAVGCSDVRDRVDDLRAGPTTSATGPSSV